MIVQVSIERDGEVLATRTLGRGEHGIGRAPDNAVVLADKAVSSHHAVLRVGDDGVELLDQGSLNGIFVDGEKVGKILCDRPVTADICGFRLVLSPKAPPKRHLPRPRLRLATRPAILALAAVLAVGAFVAAWLPARNGLDTLRQREALQRGALLARSLAEQNLVPLHAKLLDQLRTASVAAEEGVRQAVVTDPYGKVLAPPTDLGKVLDDPQIRQSLKEPGLRLWTGPEGDTVLACPIRDGQTVLGLAVIVFKPELALPPLDRTGGALLGLLAVGLLWAAASWGILRLALGPVRLVAEDIGVALKSGGRELAVVPASDEVAELKHAVERLLVLAPAGAASPGDPARATGASGLAAGSMAQGVRANDDRAHDAGPPTPPPAGADDAAWCLLDLAGYRLTDWSPGFAAHLRSRDLAPPVHLLSALADPAMLAAVAGAVDDPAPDAVRQVENRALTARKEPGPGPGTVRVRITEAA